MKLIHSFWYAVFRKESSVKKLIILQIVKLSSALLFDYLLQIKNNALPMKIIPAMNNISVQYGLNNESIYKYMYKNSIF